MNTSGLSQKDSPDEYKTGGLFQNQTFLTLFGIGALQSAIRWLELLAFGVYIFDLTGSPWLVTLVTLVKFAPLAIFGPLFGALPNRFAPRSLYIAGIVAMLLTNAVALLLTTFSTLSVFTVLIISFIGGLFWVLDFPVRRALIGDAVERGQLGRAMAIDTIANNGTRMLGPVLGGILLQFVGLSGAFAIALLIYALCLWLTSGDGDLQSVRLPDALIGRRDWSRLTTTESGASGIAGFNGGHRCFCGQFAFYVYGACYRLSQAVHRRLADRIPC